MKLQTLNDYLNQLLEPSNFKDYCPNGLQIEGKSDVKKIVTGVSACQQLIDKAVEKNADALLVHHGYFWNAEDPCIVGMKKKRISTLLQHQINLFAYHLPLDAHIEFGNNIQLAKVLNIDIDLTKERKNNLLFSGKLFDPMMGHEFSSYLYEKLNREPLYIPGNDTQIKTIAWCTGAAQDYIAEALELGVDAFLTGEVSERTVHFARENEINFYAAGHHATERYGIKALGEHIAQQFSIEHEFVDIQNPV